MTYDELQRAFNRAYQLRDLQSMPEMEAQSRKLNTLEGAAFAEQIRGAYELFGGNSSEAVASFEKSLDLWTEIGDDKSLSSIERDLGACYGYVGDYVKSIEHLQRARAISIRCNDTLGTATSQTNLGNTWMAIGDLPAALKCMEESLQIYEELGDVGSQVLVIGNLGLLYGEAGDSDRAMEFFRKQEQLALLNGNIFMATTALQHTASVLGNNGQYEESLACFYKCLATFKEVGVMSAIHEVQNHICSLFILLQRFDEADALLAEQLAVQQDHDYDYCMLLINQTVLQTHRLNFEGARISGLEALEIARITGNRTVEAEVHRALRDNAKAINDLTTYIQHNDELTRIEEEIRGKAATRELAKIEMDKKNAEQQKERDKERALLFGTLPKSIAERKLRGEDVSSDHYTNAAVLFADVVAFTSHTSDMPASDVVQLLAHIFTSFDKHCDTHNVVKVKTMGDSYMCFKADATATVNAHALASVANAMQQEHFTWPNNTPIQFRVGIHIGPATAGVIGTDRLQYDVWGDTVNVASRMESTCEPGKIHITEQFANALSDERRQEATSSNEKQREATSGDTKRREVGTWHLAHGTWHLAHRGETELKGKGSMHTYWLTVLTQ